MSVYCENAVSITFILSFFEMLNRTCIRVLNEWLRQNLWHSVKRAIYQVELWLLSNEHKIADLAHTIKYLKDTFPLVPTLSCVYSFFLQTKTKKFVWFRLLLFCRCLLSFGRIHLCVKVSKFVSQTIEAKSIVTTQSWNGIAEIIWQMFQIRKKNTFAAFGISTKFTFN